jgi:hypothetical protein
MKKTALGPFYAYKRKQDNSGMGISEVSPTEKQRIPSAVYPTKIWIEIRGGNLAAVYSTHKNVDLTLIDWDTVDNKETDEELNKEYDGINRLIDLGQAFKIA